MRPSSSIDESNCDTFAFDQPVSETIRACFIRPSFSSRSRSTRSSSLRSSTSTSSEVPVSLARAAVPVLSSPSSFSAPTDGSASVTPF